jgi:hypothetical protein
VILVDANIPMYLVGAEHPNKERARAFVERAILDEERLVSDAEVVQEILHRFVAIGRRDAVDSAIGALLDLVDEVLPIELRDVRRAAGIVAISPMSARDALHLAVMQHHGIDRILSFDHAFDGLPGVTRLPA